MMNTFKDARISIADSVRNGLDPAHGEVAKRVNQAHRNLMNRMDSKYKRSFMELYSHNGHVVCPSSVERIIRHTIEDYPRMVYSKHYQFLPYGPGSRERLEAGRYGDLVDEGAEFATFFDPHVALNLMFFSDSPDDGEKTVYVQGMPSETFLPHMHTFDDQGMETVEVPIIARNNGLEQMVWDPSKASDIAFYRVNRVVKPVTAGNLILMGWVENDSEMPYLFPLAKYGKAEKVPSYHRYRLAGSNDGEEVTIFALVQRAHAEMSSDNDIPTIQNMMALEMESRSIEAFRTDAGRGVHFQNIAAKLVREEVKNNYVESTEITFDVDDSVGPRGM